MKEVNWRRFPRQREQSLRAHPDIEPHPSFILLNTKLAFILSQAPKTNLGIVVLFISQGQIHLHITVTGVRYQSVDTIDTAVATPSVVTHFLHLM